MSIEVVYLEHNNPNLIAVRQDGVLLDFSTVTRMTVEFARTDIVADSGVDANLFDWTQGGGVIEFNFNELAVPRGTYRATLTVYDPQHTDGQVLFHADVRGLRFRFIND